jgi:hypothetical protein
MARRQGVEVFVMSHTSATPIVFVVDDDVSVRESLELLIRNEGRQVQTFKSALESSPIRGSLRRAAWYLTLRFQTSTAWTYNNASSIAPICRSSSSRASATCR